MTVRSVTCQANPTRGCRLFASCGRSGISNGGKTTFCANEFQIRSYRRPRFTVRFDESRQSSCAHAPYFQSGSGVRNADESDTPTW